jgi:prepilin-type N-terminal cleavage/methylation domain-containing protein
MRSAFTMIELIFVIVILGILGAVAIPRISAARDEAQLANANENICINLKGPLMSYAARHNGSLAGADLGDYSELNEWTKNGATLVSGTNLVETDGSTTLGSKYALTNPTYHIYLYFVDGNESIPYGCYIGTKSSYTTTSAEARAKMAAGNNFL